MNRLVRFYKITGIALFLVLVGAACLPTAAVPTPANVLQTVEVTRLVTQIVTQVVEVPVTITPTWTPAFTDTPTFTPTLSTLATITPTPGTLTFTVRENSQCLYGPGTDYLLKSNLLVGDRKEVIGRNLDGTWLYVQGLDHKNPCWLKATIGQVDAGNVQDTPVTEPVLPFSNLYKPPSAVSTNRVGNDVTVFWLPVSMTESDYHGYLIEAWVCRSGAQVFLPVGHTPPFAQNNAMMAVKITDEPGCVEPSSARIYTVDKLGYSAWRKIPWPPAEPVTASPTMSPTP